MLVRQRHPLFFYVEYGDDEGIRFTKFKGPMEQVCVAVEFGNMYEACDPLFDARKRPLFVLLNNHSLYTVPFFVLL